MCFSDFSFRNTFCVSMGKTLWKSQNMSLNGFFRGKHHPAPAVLTGSILTEIITLRYSTSVFSNSHFSGLRKRLCFQSSYITLQVTLWCSSRVSVNIRMSSRYTTTTHSIIKSSKISSIMVWNVTGLLHSPKNITSSSKSPRFVQNAAFHSSPSFIWTLLNPHRTSCLVKYLAPLSLSMNSEMRGSGYLFLTVIVFRAR